MALIDLVGDARKVTGYPCAFGEWFDTLPTDDPDPDAVTQQSVRELMACDAPDTAKARVLNQVGFTIHHHNVRRHRVGECQGCNRAGRLS